MFKKTVAFAKAMAAQIAAGCPMANEEERKERHAICQQCPELIEEEYRCGKCKCYLELKIPLKTSICPLGNWPDIMKEGNSDN